MPIHKLISGDAKYLPFALTKLRELEGQGDGAWNWFVDDGTTVSIRIIGDEQFIRIDGVPWLLSYTFKTTPDSGGTGLFHTALINPEGAAKLQHRETVDGSGVRYAVYNCLINVGDGYFLRWEAQGPGFSAPIYSGNANDAFYPILEAIGNAKSYTVGSEAANQKGNGCSYATTLTCFYAGEAGLQLAVTAYHGLSLVPMGQWDADGAYGFMWAGRKSVGLTVDNKPIYQPSFFRANTRNKMPDAVYPPTAAGRVMAQSHTYAIGRGVAMFVVGFPDQAATVNSSGVVTSYLPDLPAVLFRTPDFGATWQTVTAPVLSKQPTSPPPAGTVVCVGGPTGSVPLGGLTLSTFNVMSKDGSRVLWILPNVSISNGDGTYQRQATAVLTSSDGGQTFTMLRTVPCVHNADSFWFKHRVFGEGCMWFYGSADAAGNGGTFNRWVTYDYGVNWMLAGAGYAAGEYVAAKPYVDGDHPGRLFTHEYHADVPSLGIAESTGEFLTYKHDMNFIKGDTFVEPAPAWSGFYVEFYGKPTDKDKVFPALPGLMRMP